MDVHFDAGLDLLVMAVADRALRDWRDRSPDCDLEQLQAWLAYTMPATWERIKDRPLPHSRAKFLHLVPFDRYMSVYEFSDMTGRSVKVSSTLLQQYYRKGLLERIGTVARGQSSYCYRRV